MAQTGHARCAERGRRVAGGPSSQPDGSAASSPAPHNRCARRQERGAAVGELVSHVAVVIDCGYRAPDMRHNGAELRRADGQMRAEPGDVLPATYLQEVDPFDHHLLRPGRRRPFGQAAFETVDGRAVGWVRSRLAARFGGEVVQPASTTARPLAAVRNHIACFTDQATSEVSDAGAISSVPASCIVDQVVASSTLHRTDRKPPGSLTLGVAPRPSDRLVLQQPALPGPDAENELQCSLSERPSRFVRNGTTALAPSYPGLSEVGIGLVLLLLRHHLLSLGSLL
jgi:hypothetical protein